MDRKYMETEIEELEKLVKQNLRKRQVLGEILDELTHRRTKRAKQLRREVGGLLSGEVKLPPPPPRPERPEDQLEILDGRPHKRGS